MSVRSGWLVLALSVLGACSAQRPGRGAGSYRSGSTGGEATTASVASTGEEGPPAAQPPPPEMPVAGAAPATPPDDGGEGDAVVALHEREVLGGQQELLGATACRDVCRACAQICTAAAAICRLTAGAGEPRCERARRACSDATAQRDGRCAVCPG